MQICKQQFNLYFVLSLSLGLLLCGCQTEKRQKEKEVGTVRIHLEAEADNPDTTQSISVLRADPISLTIDKEPLFSEANLAAAKLINTEGGFAIQFNFDESSSMILEQYTASYLGKHLAIFGQWGTKKHSDGRWLAAPMITQRIYNGTLTFTPDMSRTEADQFVLGLTNVIKKIQKGQMQ